ncbi:MAG: hypothetical protein ACK45U_01670 [bacterium]|jgi:hypothetical protein
MRNRFLGIALSFIAILSFNSCSTELDIAANYKEIPVVFGMLTKGDTVQYIKINKAYLNTEGSAITAGSNLDSNIFPYPLIVKLYGYNPATNVIIDSVTLDTVIINKDPGNFNANNVLFKTPAGYKLKYVGTPNINADTNWCIYELVVRKASNNAILVKSRTRLVEDFRLTSTGTFLNLAVPTSNTQTPVEYRNSKLTWTTPQYGRQFNGYMIFKFREVNDATGESIEKSIMRNIFVNNRIDNLESNSDDISYTVQGQQFYDWIQNELDPLEATAARREYIAPIEFHFEYAGDELSQYYQINNNNVSLSDVSPEFTNIEGGFGVFSSRMRKSFKDVVRTNLSLQSIQELKDGRITGRAAGTNDLGFR